MGIETGHGASLLGPRNGREAGKAALLGDLVHLVDVVDKQKPESGRRALARGLGKRFLGAAGDDCGCGEPARGRNLEGITPVDLAHARETPGLLQDAGMATVFAVNRSPVPFRLEGHAARQCVP